MISLGQEFGSRKVKKQGKPQAKGYEVMIVGTEVKESKSGNQMLVLQVDISDGDFKGYFSKYPLNMYYPFLDAEGKQIDTGLDRMRNDLDVIVAENAAMFPEPEIDWDKFEEKRLVGTRVGGVLKYDSNGYLGLWYITTVEKALAAKVTERKPSEPQLDTSNPNGLF